MFSHAEHSRKVSGRHVGNDKRSRRSHNTNMAKTRTSGRDYEALRASSGWYLAAWRDFRGLTLEDLALELGTTRGRVSDFETGALRSNGQLAARINRDAIEAFSRALTTTGGRLIDINPFALDAAFADLERDFGNLDERDKQEVSRLAATLLKRSSAA